MTVMEPLRRAKGFAALAGLVIAGLVFASTASGQQPITYQGQLKQSGAPFTGMADLEFRLYDSLVGGTQVGGAIARSDWPVEEGLFQVELDFGAGSFGADPRWLQITVDGSTLAPRQRVHAAPMAMFALAGNEGPPGPEGPAGDSHWIINGAATAYLDGPVGIGTATPAAVLDVRGNSSIGIPQAYLVEQEDDFARLSFGNTVSDRFWTLAALTRGENPIQDRFHLFHSVSGDVIRVNGEGNISLGDFLPSSSYRLIAADGILVTRDVAGGTLPHLNLMETSGPEPVRQLFWNAAASRGWRIDSVVDADPANERWSLSTTGTGVNADVLSVLGSGAVGIGYPAPPAALTVRSRGAWTWDSGNGRGDFYIGDSLVGLSMGVALGGGGRGVSRIWTNGGVEHLFIGSAGYGASMSILPGQVGINTTAPTATLDVDGNARVRGLSHGHARPQTVVTDAGGNLSVSPLRQITIPAAAFRPLDSVAETFINIDSIFVSSAGSTQLLIAPIVLPSGTEITSATAWLFDNLGSANLRIAMIADPLASGGSEVVISVMDSSGTSTARQQIVDAAASHVVDASTYQYYVQAFPNGGTWDGAGNLAIHGITIEYRP